MIRAVKFNHERLTVGLLVLGVLLNTVSVSISLLTTGEVEMDLTVSAVGSVVATWCCLRMVRDDIW